MIGVIYRREFLDYLKSAKFLIGFGLALAISAVSTVINIQNFTQRQQDYLAAQRDLPGNKFDVAIYRPPQVLSVLVQGKDRVLGTKASVNYLSFPDQLSGYMSEEAGARPRPLSGFGSVDFTFLVRVVLSLLVIFLAYDAVAEEKVSGTLKLALSNALPRSHLLLGKCLAGLTAVLGSLLAAAAISVLIMIVSPAIKLTGGDAARIAGLLAASALYLVVFYALSLLVSTAARHPATSLMVLLQLWIFLIVIYPHLGVGLAERFMRLPTERELAENKTAAFAPYAAEQRKVRAAYAGGDRSPATGARYLELQALEAETSHAVERDFGLRLSGQVRLARRIGFLSPAMLFDGMTERFARTGIDEYERFLGSLERYWKTKYMDLQRLRYKDLDAYRKAALPSFEHAEERAAEAWTSAVPAALVLFLLGLIFFAAASNAFLRKDVR